MQGVGVGVKEGGVVRVAVVALIVVKLSMPYQNADEGAIFLGKLFVRTIRGPFDAGTCEKAAG